MTYLHQLIQLSKFSELNLLDFWLHVSSMQWVFLIKLNTRVLQALINLDVSFFCVTQLAKWLAK